MSQEQFYQTVQLQEEYEMNTQPEALYLADNADKNGAHRVAAELHRLHAENERLKTVPMKYRRMEFNAKLQEENNRLHALNAELLEALKGLLADITEYQTINHLGGKNNHWQVIARAAIAKAEAQQ